MTGGISGRAEALYIPKNYSGVYFSPKKPHSGGEAKKTERGDVGTEQGRQMGTLISRERAEPAFAAVSAQTAPADSGERHPTGPDDNAGGRQPCPCPVCRNERKEREPTVSAPQTPAFAIDPEELLIAGVMILLLREGGNDWLPLALATLLV